MQILLSYRFLLRPNVQPDSRTRSATKPRLFRPPPRIRVPLRCFLSRLLLSAAGPSLSAMANQFYNYNATYGGPSLSSAYSSRHAAASAADPYHSDPSRYFSSDVASDALDKGYSYLNQSDPFRYSRALDVAPLSGGYGSSGGAAGLAARSSWSLVEGYSSAPGEPPAPGVKRSMEALYHPTVLGTHNTIGQSEAYFATNPYAKRPRFESASNLPVYPQRPGEKDCAHYMLTRMCKFGGSCKFDHPLWVPEGGIPDWKEVPLIPNSDALPERPGEPDCPYFLKTQKCKFGFRCKFNHPKDTVENASALMEGALETVDVSSLPEQPSEPICSFYIKTGKCKFGTNCKFHHPKNIEITAGQDLASEEQNDSVARDGEAAIGEARQIPSVSFAPALLHNSKGLPIRPGEVDCSFYLKTGSCKYGATCRFNHPDITSINPPIAATLGQSLIASPAATLPISVINPMASFLPNFDSRLAQTSLTLGSTVYPQRPGQIECDFYMKTGECKFGERCKFHHPIDRTAPAPSMVKQAPQPSVKLTLAGLPRREGAIVCPFYMKTGTCKYSAACRFDHPPPGEAIAMATVSGEEKSASDPAAAVTP